VPEDRSTWLARHVDPDTVADVELLLGGIMLPLTGPIRTNPDGTVDSDFGTGIVLTDDEAAPIAAISHDGRLEPLSQATFAEWRTYAVPPSEVRERLAPGTRAILRDRPLTAAAEAALTGPVLVLAQVGAGRVPDDVLTRTLADSVARLPNAQLVAVPLAERNVTADTEADLARQFGAAGIIGPIDEPAWADALAALDADAELPPDLGAPVTRAELRRWRPPLSRRGLTVLFSGLSGSGKSTIAAGVMSQLAMMDRRASLLDGDRVRRLLSSGLSFSRADRETNVRRIGWVAAEITKHAGVAICAPIAPYAATREWVRREVAKHGDFLLVHVATPLPVCEARDRKGLYAAARAGRIPLFTGISDPYEEPTDADLVLDTTDCSIEVCVDEVLERLIAGGWLTKQQATSPPTGSV
jgi:sulfate adenylyltransferase